MEKFTKMALLLDIYGDLTKGRRKEVLDLYYNKDYCLSEIGELFGITKQGVRDFLIKGETELLMYEETLGILRDKFSWDKKIDNLLKKKDIEEIKSGLMKLTYYKKE